ncbi:Nn.00g040940.m01.CDS01 [Neocucurbitaria sp. VM-36]
MPVDRLLSTLLRSLQTYTDQQDTPRILGTASSLLTTLGNPHNLSLLTSHILTAPALWDRPDGVRTPLRLLSVFHSAVTTIINYHSDVRYNKAPRLQPGQIPTGGGLSLDDWVRAIVAGADDRSQRWKHLIVLGGLLIGTGSLEEQGMDLYWASAMRKRVETALVRATNLALIEVRERSEADGLGGQTITLVLNHAFGCIADAERVQMDYDLLLPVLIGTAFYSNEGFQSAYFLGGLDLDVRVTQGGKLDWNALSSSYRQVEGIMNRPLVASMGPLSRLIAHSVEHVKNPWIIQTMMDDLASFSRALTTQWRQIKFSDIDPAEEAAHLEEEALHRTTPQLWNLLKATLFATTIILRGVFTRTLGDRALAGDAIAPVLASQALQTLRHLYFITSRLGPTSFSQHTFVYLTAIDILSAYPYHADKFLKSIAPQQLGQIPRHPLDRILDLYFLNTAEHFTLVLSPAANEDLLVASAVPYLAAGENRQMLPIFEAAHSVMLAVLSAPQSAEITAKHLPFYIDALFSVFPHNLSPRQFRLAFKTLMRVTAPPSTLSASHPDLPATLLELVFHRALSAPTHALPPDEVSLALQGSDAPPPALSEQAVLALTLIDALPFLPIPMLEEWMPLTAELLNQINDDSMRESVRARYWEVLVSGEMDAERSGVAVLWWTTRGGRELVLFGRESFDEQIGMMSGALPVEERNVKESKL